MKKLFFISASFLFFATSYSQTSIVSASDFVSNTASYDGKRITIKNVKIDLDYQDTFKGNKVDVKPPTNNAALGIPVLGPLPTSNNTTIMSCNTPRGFSKVQVIFPGHENFIGCYYIVDAMFDKLKNEAKGSTLLDGEVTISGNSKIGYNILLYRLY